jgi:hypothetical protein
MVKIMATIDVLDATTSSFAFARISPPRGVVKVTEAVNEPVVGARVGIRMTLVEREIMK